MHMLMMMLMWSLRGLSIAVAGNTMWLRRVMILRLRALSIVRSWRPVRLHWRHYIEVSTRGEQLVEKTLNLLCGGCCCA